MLFQLNKKCFVVMLSAVIFFLLVPSSFAQEDAAVEGDLAYVDFTASLENGEVFYTTQRDVHESATLPKADWYIRAAELKPEPIVVGKSSVFPQMANLIKDMKVGEQKKVTLPPEKAFGVKDPKLLVSRPKQSVLPRLIRMNAVDFVNSFKGFPEVGDKFNFNEYLQVKVTQVERRFATMEVTTANGTKVQDAFGVTTIIVDGDKVSMNLEPTLNASVEGFGGQFEGQKGRIVEVKEDEFIVDFNPPTRGSTIVLDMKLVKLDKSASFEDINLDWYEMFQEGVKAAQKEQKPAFVVMHSETCGWCAKYFGNSMTDPRIKLLKDEFVWVKVDINFETEIKEQFKVEGTPLTVIMSPNGELIKKIDGYRDGGALYQELQGLLLSMANSKN